MPTGLVLHCLPCELVQCTFACTVSVLLVKKSIPMTRLNKIKMALQVCLELEFNLQQIWESVL
ncbi:MAG: hypothetical protein AB2693_25045, partial [Candidatus Thiodiazotropha sp.]